MIKDSMVEQYKRIIENIEISVDISDNLKNAKTAINGIIAEGKLKEEEVVEIVKTIIKHLKLEAETKQEFVNFSNTLYRTMDKAYKEQKYQEDILNKGISNKKVDRVFPAIDYRPNLGMIYAVKGYEKNGKAITYIGTGNKKIYEIERAKEFGINTTHEDYIDTNLELSTFADFVKNGKTVKASELFIKIKEFIKKFVIVSEEFYHVLTTYIMMTYVYILFQVIPYLWITGEAGTGKSTVMKLLNKLSFNALFCSNINPANIFRQIDNDGSTIIIDECEKMYGEDKQEIIKLLNQGFNKDGIVVRCVGQNNKVKKFKSFSPKVMGGINNIDNVLYERCIKYETKRVRGTKITKFKETKQNLKDIDEIVDDLYIFGFLYAEKIKNIYDNEEVSFKGNTLREDDLWNPLLCIGKIIDEEQDLKVQENLLIYAKKLSKEKFDRYVENNPKLQLLYYLYEYFYTGKTKVHILKDGRVSINISLLYRYLKGFSQFNWIKSSSALGKKLNQLYGFEKKRELTGNEFNPSEKATYYIFDSKLIKEIMEEEGVTLSDFE